MTVRIRIDKISLAGLAWSASQRRLFELSFASLLREAIAIEPRLLSAEIAPRRLGFESLSIGFIDAGHPELVARALAFPLTQQLLADHGDPGGGAPKAGGS